MALPAIGAALKAAKAARAAKKLKAKDSKVMSKKELEKELKKPETKARMEAESERQKEFGSKIDKRIKETKKNKPNASFQDLLEATEDIDFKKGGLARRKRKSDGGLKVGQRKVAKGCGAIMSNRRKKTLYR